MQTDHAIRLKRLRFRSWHRGCKETDLILGHFCDALLEQLSPSELDDFEHMLEESDADIWDWITGKQHPGNSGYITLLQRLRDFSSPSQA